MHERAIAVLAACCVGVALADATIEYTEVDLDGDGMAEIIGLSQNLEQVVVTVAQAGSTSLQELAFGFDHSMQGALCEAPAELSVVPLQCKPGGDILPGCKEIANASGLQLRGGECDSIYLYWNHDKGSVWWWRA